MLRHVQAVNYTCSVVLYVPILCSVSVWDKRWGYVPHSSDLGLWSDFQSSFTSVRVWILSLSLLVPSFSCSSFHLTLKVGVNTWKDWWPFNENVSIPVVEGVGLLCVSETRHILHDTRAFTNSTRCSVITPEYLFFFTSTSSSFFLSFSDIRAGCSSL